MSRDTDEINRLQVGEMPLIRKVIEQLHLRDILLKYIKPHKNERIPAVDSLLILLINITAGRQPLYEIEQWAQRIDPRIFGFKSFKPGVINDDRFGRALYKLYLSDRASMMTEIVLSMIKFTGLELSRVHNDSTTVKAYGKIPGRTRAGLKLEQGHSKDHRPDLKQIVYSLSVSADGAVPVHYKTYAGNRTDDTTHIETWNTLRKIIGRPSFLYVADSKVCTDKQLSHIVKYGGRVVTIIPETWKEVRDFKEELRKNKKNKKIIWRRTLPEESETIEYFSCFTGNHRSAKGNYTIHWLYSSEKKRRDRETREKALKKAEYELADLCGKLNMRHMKAKENILKKINEITEGLGVERYFYLKLNEVLQTHKKQIGIGRPSPKTKYRTVKEKLYSLSYTRNQRALKEERNVDGVFPLLATDSEITPKDALLAYKYQPRLEKRFTQFKSVHNAAPLLFKRIERVEGIMFLFFIALMIQAIIEREVRLKMKDKNIIALPVYPEHRIAFHPTTAKIFDRFEGTSLYRLKQCGVVKTLRDDLSNLQLKIIKILGISECEYWSEG
ncbi:MAG: IS1634 family transposase [Nitrospinota bacterium]